MKKLFIILILLFVGRAYPQFVTFPDADLTSGTWYFYVSTPSVGTDSRLSIANFLDYIKDSIGVGMTIDTTTFLRTTGNQTYTSGVLNFGASSVLNFGNQSGRLVLPRQASAFYNYELFYVDGANENLRYRTPTGEKTVVAKDWLATHYMDLASTQTVTGGKTVSNYFRWQNNTYLSVPKVTNMTTFVYGANARLGSLGWVDLGSDGTDIRFVFLREFGQPTDSAAMGVGEGDAVPLFVPDSIPTFKDLRDITVGGLAPNTVTNVHIVDNTVQVADLNTNAKKLYATYPAPVLFFVPDADAHHFDAVPPTITAVTVPSTIDTVRLRIPLINYTSPTGSVDAPEHYISLDSIRIDVRSSSSSAYITEAKIFRSNFGEYTEIGSSTTDNVPAPGGSSFVYSVTPGSISETYKSIFLYLICNVPSGETLSIYDVTIFKTLR